MSRWTMVAIPVSMVKKGRCPIHRCLRKRHLSALNPSVERGEANAPAARHHPTDAEETIIINLLNEYKELII